ncbi:hypothetical protein ACTVNX_03615 [Serratia nevei]|uniref:hypothetical protein n=1 Tax=Serratia TaxID=613 RepID=UPI0018D7CF51|nr:hypothetical protein [Serratia marcescens]MBH2871198.1 hypothetical protein [Serratia marcescens]MBI6126345.1 hypothetical protein [Serratia marcescens]MBN5185123.1 hypothetical protein [Serratia marcescens]MBN5194897.1 hypothetical protein [Serratia marcescens]MBN5301082.1 hypothetical protein [Serratia marcescens]
MKMKSYRSIPLRAYLGVVGVLGTAILLFFIQVRQERTPPSCATVIKTFITLDARPTHGVILVNTTPSALGAMKVLLSGKIEDGDVSYTVSKELIMRYAYKGTHYPMTVEKSIDRVRDSVSKTKLDKVFPQEGQYLHMKISRIDENTYAFTDNYSPIFICTTR